MIVNVKKKEQTNESSDNNIIKNDEFSFTKTEKSKKIAAKKWSETHNSRLTKKSK